MATGETIARSRSATASPPSWAAEKGRSSRAGTRRAPPAVVGSARGEDYFELALAPFGAEPG
eukprot:3524263-Lingulodinium_polyedra.AAC.1